MLNVIIGSHVSAVVDVVGGWLLASSVGVLVGVVDATVVSAVVSVDSRGVGVAKATQVRPFLTHFLPVLQGGCKILKDF